MEKGLLAIPESKDEDSDSEKEEPIKSQINVKSEPVTIPLKKQKNRCCGNTLT